MSFSKRLNNLLAREGMTIREAARAADVPSSTLSSWKGGSSPTDFQACARLSRALNVSLSYLLTGEDEETNLLALEGDRYTAEVEIRVKNLKPVSAGRKGKGD